MAPYRVADVRDQSAVLRAHELTWRDYWAIWKAYPPPWIYLVGALAILWAFIGLLVLVAHLNGRP